MPTVEEIRASRPREPEYARVALIMVVAGSFGVAKLYHPNTSRYIQLVTAARQAV